VNNCFLLDSWALLSFLNLEEPAASRVGEVLKAATNGDVQLFMSLINLGEVYYGTGRKHGRHAAENVLSYIEDLPIRFHPVSKRHVFAAAQFKMNYRIAYADAFAAAAAVELDAVLLTGDPELFALDGEIKIERLSRSSQTKS
jgi:uncharacterized protein